MISAVAHDSRFVLSEQLAKQLAEQFGTPLYVIDETHFRERIQRYQKAFRAAWPKSELTFASKANSTLALLAIAAQEGCLIDVASEGEFRAALRAGVPANRCHMHGNNKQLGEIEFAIEQGIAQIVVDNFSEIETLSQYRDRNLPELILRLAPGVDPQTHAKISTGQADTKFGFNISDGSAERAVDRCIELKLPLVGFHCHVGSQLLDPEAQRSGGEIIASFGAAMFSKKSIELKVINVGGGLGVRYTDADQPMEIEEYNRLVVSAIQGALGKLEPTLAQEPGRSLVAESGVTLYRVGVVKTVPSGPAQTRTYVAVDGGLSDNPRPVMYGSKYTVLRPGQNRGDLKTFTISGKHCETDKLFPDVQLPADLKEGDLLQVLCTGAYNSSMASNYNRYPRPATALIRPNGEAVLIQRADTWDEMFAREMVPQRSSL